MGFNLVRRVIVLPLADFCCRLVSDTQAEATRISFAFRLPCHEAKELTVAHVVVVRDFFMFFFNVNPNAVENEEEEGCRFYGPTGDEAVKGDKVGGE